VAKDRTKANGEGTIYKRSKGYCGQYHVVTREGIKKRRSVYAGTRAAAAEKLDAAIADRDRGLLFDAGTLTVSEHLDRYLEDARGRLRPKSFNRAEGLVRNHVKPTLGNVKLKDLSPAHVRGLYAAKLESGLSGRTVGYIHVTLYGALKQGVADGLIPRNPAEGVKPPRTDTSEMNLLPRSGKDAAGYGPRDGRQVERPLRPRPDHGPETRRAPRPQMGRCGLGERHAARAPHPSATGLSQRRPREAHAAQDQEELEGRAPPPFLRASPLQAPGATGRGAIEVERHLARSRPRLAEHPRRVRRPHEPHAPPLQATPEAGRAAGY
jgi:hypothetical protein